MKKIITAVCLTVLVLTSCQQAKQKVFEIASQEVNKQCPMTIDEMTRMDSTSYTGGDNTFTYYYTLTGAADDPNIAKPLKNIWRKTYRESSKTQMISRCTEIWM